MRDQTCFGSYAPRRAMDRTSSTPTALPDDAPAITFGRPAPHPGLLSDRECMIETGVLHMARAADRLGRLRLLLVVGIEDRRIESATCSEIKPICFLYRHRSPKSGPAGSLDIDVELAVDDTRLRHRQHVTVVLSRALRQGLLRSVSPGGRRAVPHASRRA